MKIWTDSVKRLTSWNVHLCASLFLCTYSIEIEILVNLDTYVGHITSRSLPSRNCKPKNLHEYGRVLSALMSNKNTSKNSEADCHHRCPWSTHCDQCPNCKWCWLCSSCSVPNYNCKYCRACNGEKSDCAKCCGY